MDRARRLLLAATAVGAAAAAMAPGAAPGPAVSRRPGFML
jgi:hypothetical protein